MGYTHGCAKDEEFRTCTKCGQTLLNTKEYFSWSNKINNTVSVCKKCQS